MVFVLATTTVTPTHALPWYFGAAVFGVWAAAAVGIGLLFRRRMRARAERREYERKNRKPRKEYTQKPSGVRDDRSIGPGTDIERRR
jgi:hypothetical protein